MLEVGEERRLERVEAGQRVVVEAQHVGLDRPRLGVDAGDRVRMDLVAEVGLVRLAAGDDRVGERLHRGLVRRHRGQRRIGGEDPLRDRHRRRDQRRGPEEAGVAQEVSTRQLESYWALHMSRLSFARAKQICAA